MGTKEFDENDAIEFIRGHVSKEVSDKYSDDDILLLIDTMYDFYEKDDDDEMRYEDEAYSYDSYVNELVNYVKKSLRKDPDNQIEIDDVRALVEGEIEYENTIEED